MLLSSSDFGKVLKKVCWGYAFIHLDLTFFGINVLANWIGYLLILFAVNSLAKEEEQAMLLRPFAAALAVIGGVAFIEELFMVDLDRYEILSLFHTLMWLFLQFQLLTHIAEMAKRREYPKTRRILVLRSALTVLYCVPAAFTFFFDEEWLGYAYASLYLALVVWAAFVLNDLRIHLWVNEDELALRAEN